MIIQANQVILAAGTLGSTGVIRLQSKMFLYFVGRDLIPINLE